MKDQIITSYPAVDFDQDLMYCEEYGIVYQKDTSTIIDYDLDYFNNYVGREDTDIANKLNLCRTGISEKYCDCIIDIGIGSGEFIRKSKIKVYGFDINPYGVKWLQERNLFVDPYQEVPADVRGWTLWDTLEHMPEPSEFLKLIKPDQYLFISLPIFFDLTNLKTHKHFKPGEHLIYFTKEGLIKFITDCGFEFLESNNMETLAGREDIMTFVFRKK